MKHTALDRLKAYRAKHFKNDYELAALLHLTKPHMSQILSGKRRPGLAIAVRIEDATGIPARSWADMRVSRQTKPDTRKLREAVVDKRESSAVAG